MSIRVLIVDPQPFFCEALAVSLADRFGFDVVGWTTRASDAYRRILEDHPDVAVTELDLEEGSGVDLAAKARDHTNVVMLTRAPEGDVLRRALEAGARGCLSHRMTLEAIAEACTRAAGGEFVIDQDRLEQTLKRLIARGFDAGSSTSDLDRLTSREREVLELMAQGLDNDLIAERLNLSAHTARTHIGKILKKLGVHSRAEAVRRAAEVSGTRQAHVLRLHGPNLEAK